MRNTNNRYQFGLDRKESEEALEAFLEPGNEDRVFAVKGDWGIGKTHLVKAFLTKTKQDYYYGSAFGISTIEELKMQLWSNFRSGKQTDDSESSKLNPRKWFESIKENSQNIGSLVEAIPKMGEYGAGFTPAVITLLSNVVINNSLKGKLICIDDLERRSKNLPLDELLGFIEGLAEEKECKVILIYNENRINNDLEASNILKEYREKIIDHEIKLDPSLAENFYIGFGKNDPDENVVFNYFDRETVQANNIRIFKKLKWNLEKLRPYISDFLPNVRHQIINEIIFISLAKLDSNFPVNLDRIVSLDDFSKVLLNKDEEGQKLYLLAHSLGYTDSPISNEIIRLVETSICDYQRFCEEGNKLNDREINHAIKEKLHEAYKPYSESFEPSEEELCKNLTGFLDQYWSFLGFRELQDLASISAAIRLNIKSYIEKWIRCQIDSSEKLEELYSLQSILLENRDFATDNLIYELEEKILVFEEEMSIDSILIKVSKSRTWSKKDVDYLNARTLEQWSQWLLERHPEKHSMVRQGLRMEEKFSQTLKKAIANLAQKSKLNAMRAEKIYGVDIENSNSL